MVGERQELKINSGTVLQSLLYTLQTLTVTWLLVSKGEDSGRMNKMKDD